MLYAFFRVADGVADDVEGEPSRAAQREQLERYRATALGKCDADGVDGEVVDLRTWRAATR